MDVVTCSADAAAATTILKLAVVLCAGEPLSLTFTVNEKVPAVVGVPLICPPLLNVNPAGKAPELIAQLYGVVPPVAPKLAVYGAVKVPGGSAVTEI